MSEVNWNALMNAPNAGAAFMEGYNRSVETKRQNALQQQQMQEHQEDRQLRRDQLMAERAKAGLEQHRDRIIMGGRLIEQIKPQDDAGWQQVRAIAAQAGMDVSDIPEHYDPQYADGVVKAAHALDPQKAERPQLVPFTQGGGVAAYNPSTGQIETLVAPNDGSHPAGTPVSGTPPVLTDDQIRQMMNGGQTPPASGGFR